MRIKTKGFLLYFGLVMTFEGTNNFLMRNRNLIRPVGIFLLKVNNRNRTRCEICSKLTIKTPERRLAPFWCLCC